MKFLVYVANPHEEHTTLKSFEDGTHHKLTNYVDILNDNDLQRAVEKPTVQMFVDNVNYNKSLELITADIYKQTNERKALHRLAEDGDELSIQELLSKNEDAFYQGMLGIKYIDGETFTIVENKFGSYFASSCRGMDLAPRWSSETVETIRDSESIGETELEFMDEFDLEATLFEPHEDADVREEEGFGDPDIPNKLASLINLSKAHKISLDISREKWLENVQLFNDLIEAGIVKTVRVRDTKENTVKLGKGGHKAIRKTIETTKASKAALTDAFGRLEE